MSSHWGSQLHSCPVGHWLGNSPQWWWPEAQLAVQLHGVDMSMSWGENSEKWGWGKRERDEGEYR